MNKTIWYRFIVEIQNSTPTSNYVLRGDLTTDGGFDALDFAFMRTVLLGIRRIYEPYTYIADVDDDGDADSIDFMLMRQKLMGMIKEFPGGTLYYYVMYKGNEKEVVAVSNMSSYMKLGWNIQSNKATGDDGPSVTIPEGKGTIISYMGYHLITLKSSPKYKLKENAQNNNRYSIKNPEYYALIDYRKCKGCIERYRAL